MKRYQILIAVFVLTAALMTGCGCTGPSMDQTEAPTVLPTNEEVRPSTKPTTQPTTQDTTEPTMTTETHDNGNGALTEPTVTNATDPTEGTGTNRAKMR